MAPKNTLKVVAKATESSPGAQYFRESFEPASVALGSALQGYLYSKGFYTISGQPSMGRS